MYHLKFTSIRKLIECPDESPGRDNEPAMLKSLNKSALVQDDSPASRLQVKAKLMSVTNEEKKTN